MREIKFRGYDGMDWIYGSAVQYDKETDTWYMIENGAPDDDWMIVGEVGQYTGLKDKNGKEIYEGDILKFIEVTNKTISEYLTDVRWEDCAFVVKSGGNDYDTWLGSWSSDPNNTYPLFEIEVVGNIYENPELLEVEVDG